MSPIPWRELRVITPELILTVWSFLVLVAGLLPRSRRACAPLALVGCLLAGVALLHLSCTATTFGPVLYGMLAWDPVARLFKGLSLGVLVFVLLMAHGDQGVGPDEWGEYYCLLLLVGVGMMFLAAAHHLLMVILAMELMSLCSYLLVAFQRGEARSSEAALKYFLFGALTSALFLYGASLLYALTRSLDLSTLRVGLVRVTPPQAGLLIIAGTLLLIGFGFKISMVPVHLWTPDAYEGAPIPVAALLSIGPKAAGFAVLLRVFGVNLGDLGLAWMPLVSTLTILTMTLGNLVALVQTNIKRLLAYSTIAQVGYLLIGFAVADRLGEASLWLYLIAYLLMNCGAFTMVSAVTNVTGSESLEAYRGLAQRSPRLALLFALFLLSLAGMPPLAGFLGKFYLFGAALSTKHPWLAVAGAVNSVIALAYYVKVIRIMYLEAPVERTAIAMPWSLHAASLLAAAGTLAIGLYPTPLLRLLGRSLSFIF